MFLKFIYIRDEFVYEAWYLQRRSVFCAVWEGFIYSKKVGFFFILNIRRNMITVVYLILYGEQYRLQIEAHSFRVQIITF